MTLEEAKKILKKGGFESEKHPGITINSVGEIPVWEKIAVSEAMRVVAKNSYVTLMRGPMYDERKARLQKEYEENTKSPGPGEEQTKGKIFGKEAIWHSNESASEIPLSAEEGIKLKWKDNRNTSENPALKESATQFNDALLDEQAKEIKRLKKENAELLGIVERMKLDVKEVDINFNAVCKENERLNEKIRELIKEKSNLEDQITVLNACKKHNDKIDRKQIKSLGKEIARLNGIIHDKNAVLADVAEELRLSKIREKNLTEVSQKYMKENEELKNQLADKVVDEINANALKSAESALACKEQLIYYKDKIIAYYKKKYVWYKGAYDAAQQILNTIADYAAKHPDKKFSDQMVEENHPTEDKLEEVDVDKILERVRKALEEGHTVSTDYKD